MWREATIDDGNKMSMWREATIDDGKVVDVAGGHDRRLDVDGLEVTIDD